MQNQRTKELNHLGLILDGNRRWARNLGLQTFEGHAKGFDNFKEIAKAGVNLGIPYISAFVFSTENWNRAKDEVKYLMGLALKIATKDVDELNKENIKVVFLGSKENINKKLLKAMENAEQLTNKNTRGTIAICFNYGGKDEIVHAVKLIVDKGTKSEDITEVTIEQNLYSNEIPPVDILVRTSGEIRTSGFMLWRAAYSEMMFFDKYWPDFNTSDLKKVITEYKKRNRRFGS